MKIDLACYWLQMMLDCGQPADTQHMQTRPRTEYESMNKQVREGEMQKDRARSVDKYTQDEPSYHGSALREGGLVPVVYLVCVWEVGRKGGDRNRTG